MIPFLPISSTAILTRQDCGRIKAGKNHSCVQDFTDKKLGRLITHQFRGETVCSPVLLTKAHHSESCFCSSSRPNSSFKRQISRESVTHQNGKCACSPSLRWKCYKAQSVILMVLTFFNWRKLRASPVLLGTLLHGDMRTLRGWKTFKWLSLASQVLPPVTHKSRKGNVAILTWCNVAQEDHRSLTATHHLKATFFLLRKPVTAGGEATHGLCGEGLSLPPPQNTDTPGKTFQAGCPCFMETHLPRVQHSLAGKRSQPPPWHGCRALTQSTISFWNLKCSLGC